MDNILLETTAVNEEEGLIPREYEPESAELPVEKESDHESSVSTLESSNDSKNPRETYIRKRIQCDICSYTCGNKFALKRHMNIHSDERNFECHSCEKKFSYRYNLTRHLKTHTNESPSECYVCSKTFRSAWALKRHMTVHTGRVLFGCDFCDKSYTRRDGLMVHLMKAHAVDSNEKLFECDNCTRKFNFSYELNKHVQKYHTGKALSVCKICHKYCDIHRKFQYAEQLFECEICSQKLTTKLNWFLHMETHDVVRKFQCGLCPQSFVQSSALKRHQLNHTGGKPYVYWIIKKGYGQSCNFKKQEKLHMDEDRDEDLPGNSSDIKVEENDIEIETEVDVSELQFAPLEENELENRVGAFYEFESGYFTDEDMLDNESTVVQEILSGMINHLNPIQRKICDICFKDDSGYGIAFPELIFELQKSFVSESQGFLKNIVVQMTEKILESNSVLLIRDLKSETDKSELGDDISRYRNASVKLSSLASSILSKIKADDSVDDLYFKE